MNFGSPRAALAALAAGLFLSACSAAQPDEASAPAQAEAGPVLSFAVIGDAEPKPEPVFPGVSAAVDDINRLAADGQIQFAIGVGDIAHDGTIVQYDAVTPVLKRLTVPFFPIMGNEELTSTVERYLGYAAQWNPDVTEARYVQDRGPVTMIYASPDEGREFADSGIDWMLAQIRASTKPVFLIVHSAQAGVYPENAEKGVANPRFAEVIAEPRLAAVISGDLHMDLDRTEHSKQIGRVHYLHMPALERTKIPDETSHVPMFRTIAVDADNEVVVRSYRTGDPAPIAAHEYRFSLAPYLAG